MNEFVDFLKKEFGNLFNLDYIKIIKFENELGKLDAIHYSHKNPFTNIITSVTLDAGYNIWINHRCLGPLTNNL
jgi:hypothetical protein